MITSTSEPDHGGIPPWEIAELPEPKPLGWRNWTSFIGPGIVMMGIQIGGGEWLFGPSMTAKYGGGLMWLATVAILGQVFYNIECGRYALYCGEPVFTGFMRCRPGPGFWIGVMLVMNSAALIPGLSSHGASLIAALYLDRPPTPDDNWLIVPLAFACLAAVALPVLIGGKVYNMLQVVMTAKVFVVLGFCLAIGLTCVSFENWCNVFSGFVKFGNVPVTRSDGTDVVVNAIAYRSEMGVWPIISVANIVMLGAFAGYAGGGGLSNSTYSNFVRDKGWGMGQQVGAIPSAVSGHNVSLSHVGKVFELTADNLRKWKGWWRYILTDQAIVWAPGCFIGMALPALISMQFAQYSTVKTKAQIEVAQAAISADGIRHAEMFSPKVAQVLWIVALFTGLMVMMPSQMSVVDDFSRRWTDTIWTANRRVRQTMQPHQVKWIYYFILSMYVLWSFVCAYFFRAKPKLMTEVISNLNNVAIGATSFQLLWINHTLLPPVLRPKWYNTAGVLVCGVFYLGLAALVFTYSIWPLIVALFTKSS